jgi:fructose-1-phosphate kinase PfkB-like protein
MAEILVVGLNPAWQTILGFRDFHPGEVNRAHSAESLASGKGINAAKVLARLGHRVTVLQILGGDSGRKCLEGCEALGIRSLQAWVKTETRRCLTLLHRDVPVTAAGPVTSGGSVAPGESTEIIEPFRVEEPGTREALLAALPADPGAFEAVAICGTVPPGAGEGIYDALLERLRPRVSVVDAWQGLRPESLAKATCLKMNQSEYASLKEAVGGQALGEALFLLTSGAGEASVLRRGARIGRLAPPPLPSVANPIGAGDTVTAGVVHHLLSGLDPVEAFRHGLAMGSASCLLRLPAEYREEDVSRLLPLTRVLA